MCFRLVSSVFLAFVHTISPTSDIILYEQRQKSERVMHIDTVERGGCNLHRFVSVLCPVCFQINNLDCHKKLLNNLELT
jgi:hypothetical protein